MPTGDAKWFDEMREDRLRGYDISQTIDGEWRTPTRRNFYRACCDCGLVHREEYRVKNGRVQYRVWRDVEETKRERKRIARRS